MTDPVDDGEEFDLKAEAIAFFRKAKSEATRFKTLELIATLMPKGKTVKPESKDGEAAPAALAAQRKMNGGS